MRHRIVSLAVLSLCCALSFGAHAQTAQEGKAAFVACSGCHSVDGSAKPTGPTLKGVVGRKAASVAAYLKAPATRVKGTTMMIATPDAKRRKAIVAYLGTLK